MNREDIKLIQFYKRLILSLLVLLLLSITGCIIPTLGLLPVSGRGEISKTERAFLSVGRTTREEVLLRLGEPDITLCDERIFVYRWVLHRVYLLAPTGAQGDVVTIHLLLLEFDQHGKLKRFDQPSSAMPYPWNSVFGTSRSRIKEWMPPDCPRPDWEKNKIHTIRPSYRVVTQTECAIAAVRSLRVKLGVFSDDRSGLYGSKIGMVSPRDYHQLIHYEIHTYDKAADIIRDAMKEQFQNAGYILVDDTEDIVVTGKILDFRIDIIGIFDLDAQVKIDAILELQNTTSDAKSMSSRYHSKKVKSLYDSTTGFPVELKRPVHESAVGACIEDVLKQMCSDAELATFLRR